MMINAWIRAALLRERNANFRVGADLPDDQIAAMPIEVATEAWTKGASTISRRFKRPNGHSERDRKRGQQAKEDQQAHFDEGWSQGNRVHVVRYMASPAARQGTAEAGNVGPQDPRADREGFGIVADHADFCALNWISGVFSSSAVNNAQEAKATRAPPGRPL
jgi:hypothetical protein